MSLCYYIEDFACICDVRCHIFNHVTCIKIINKLECQLCKMFCVKTYIQFVQIFDENMFF